MAALTAHYVTHARFLWKWLRNPDNRRNKLPFRQIRWAFQPVPLPLRQIQYRFVYGISIYREKDLRGNDGTNGCLRGKGSRLTAQRRWKAAWEMAHGRRGLRAVENQPAHVAETAGQGLYRLFANRLPFLLQAGRCKKAYTAYRYNLPH